ncbi:MAG: hypothetical protein ABWZ40_14510 [Caulobacterales bacterium]
MRFPDGMNGQEKHPSSAPKPAASLREDRLAEALRENLRRRKVAKKRASSQEGEDDEGPLDDRD